jgi:hypothetical protein
MRRPNARLAIDLVIVCSLLVGSAIWATRYWNTWVARGGKPLFYQEYFEAAVMIACGHGFVVTPLAQPPTLADFLHQRRDTFSCTDIPPTLELSQRHLFQRPWRYLMYTVGYTWRVFGISWSGMGPLFGGLFGISIALVYAICRMGMAAPVAAVCAVGVAVSTVHLGNLPHLRDFAKEPFTLALIFVLGLLVSRPIRLRTVVLLAAAYGAILGIGYGFRTDFLINIPLFLVTVAVFLEGGPFRNIKLKAFAVAAFAAAFLATGWPILSSVYRSGGCQWHVALLGLQAPFTAPLSIQPAPYDFGYAYADNYIYKTVSSFAQRTSPGVPRIEYCSHEYDVASGRYLRDLVGQFPADFVTRAYSSMLVISELPFLRPAAPLPNWAPGIYERRTRLLKDMPGLGIFLVLAALVLASSTNVRLGLFLLFFAAYLAGYPAIQFQERHFFHLEFLAWWALGFVAYQIAAAVWRIGRDRSVPPAAVVAGLRRVAIFAAIALLLAVAPLEAMRAYQSPRVKQLLSSYVTAPKTRIPLPNAEPHTLVEMARPAAGEGQPAGPIATQFIEMDLDRSRCRADAAVTFRYDRAFPYDDFTYRVTLPASDASGPTRIFLAVFDRFTGFEFSDPRPECVIAAYRFDDLRPYPLLVDAVLPPNWADRPLYQRLADWPSRLKGFQ